MTYPLTADGRIEKGRFYQHGWQSWNVAGWRPPGTPVHYPLVAEHRLQATDPAHLDDPVPGGSGVGAIELGDGEISLLGAIGVDGWVTRQDGELSGAGADQWHEQTGSEREVFDGYASALAGVLGSRKGEPGPIWCSWYSLYRNVSEVALLKILGDLGDLPFAVFQVDDGWQRSNGDWEPNERFRSGMGSLAEQVRATDRTPGLWMAPFLVDADSELYRRYPDMILRDSTGDPVPAAHNWGQTTFALDVTRTDALEWLGSLMRKVANWGYGYLKLDFLYAAALPGAYHAPAGREQAYRTAAQVIRDAVGDDTYLLACGAPILASVGIFDGIRVGPDIAPYWDNEDRTVHLADRAGPGCADAITTSLSRFWLRPLIDIDPDVAYFRSRNNLLSPTQRSRLVDLAHICGFRATSDPPEWLDPDERGELEAFLNLRPSIEQVGRYRFRIDGREADFTDVAETRPW